MTSPIKAERKTITLGALELDVYLMPSAEYRVSLKHTSLASGNNQGWLSRVVSRGGQTAEALAAKGFHGSSVEVQFEKQTAKTLSIDDFIAVISYAAHEQGNREAQLLLEACACEAIERRADKVFGKETSDQERELRMKFRTQNREDFHPVLTASMARNGVVSSPSQWGFRIKQFQDAIGVESGKRDELCGADQMKLTIKQGTMATLLDAGIPWNTALELIK